MAATGEIIANGGTLNLNGVVNGAQGMTLGIGTTAGSDLEFSNVASSVDPIAMTTSTRRRWRLGAPAI